jgi:hypothetical protein
MNWGKLTRNELSRESVYQQNFVELNGLVANSGKKMDTNWRIASVAGSGSDLDWAYGSGIDHLPSCVKADP